MTNTELSYIPHYAGDRAMSWFDHESPTVRLERKIDYLIFLANLTRKQNTQMSAELDALTAEISQEETVESSAITLINGLAAQITAAGTDPAKLAALTQSITASSNALAQAIASNTPAGTGTGSRMAMFPLRGESARNRRTGPTKPRVS